MAKNNLKTLKNRSQKEIEKADNLAGLNQVFQRYLGKRGELTQVLRSLKELKETERRKKGKEANLLKELLNSEMEKKRKKIEKKEKKSEKIEGIDITIPGQKILLGHLHPLTQTKRKTEEIFQNMGFEVIGGPEIENEWYNFDALNIPPDHPARDMWDTFYLKGGVLLRTHTSPVQIRYMEKHNPPFRIIVPGRVYRHEATDASHETNFNQIEGLMVGKDITAANFKAVILEFFRRYFGKQVNIRLRPSYFPFTEPSFEVDISCLVCGGKGCSTCQRTGWLEMMGAGMVHPAVLKNSGLNPKNWQGFAFGIGMERMTMMRHKINDIRLFYSGNLKFLGQF